MTVNVLNYMSQSGAGGDNQANIYGTVNINGTEFTAAELLSSLEGTTTFANKTGGTLTAGTLVYISGYDTTLGAPTIAKSDADDATKQATHVVLASILTDTNGYADGVGTVTGLNTDSFSAVGSPVYESGTAGEFTQTAPTDADDTRRQVGVVKVKHASAGSIYFYPGLGGLEQAGKYLNNITPGTVVINGAVIVDSNKDASAFRTVGLVNLDAGSSGVAGTVDIFPVTALKGKIAIAATNNTNDDILSITNAAHGQATTLTIPDCGAASANFVLSQGSATVAGAKTFSTAVTVSPTTNQLVLGVTNTTTINSVAPAASRIHEISDVSGNGFFALLGAAPTAVIGSTPAEIDLQCDASLQTETIDSGVAVSVTKRITNIDNTVTGAGAITLAAPHASMIGVVKVIEMTVDGGDVTLSLANVQGGSAATTATFAAPGDQLVLVGGSAKWTVIGEGGVVLT